MTRSKPTGELVSLIDNSSIKKRYEKVSQKKNCWLETTARSDEQHVAVIQHNKAKNARKLHKRAAASFQTPVPLEVRKSACHEGISQMLRRQAIAYFYRMYFCDEPNIDDIITPIMKHCKINTWEILLSYAESLMHMGFLIWRSRYRTMLHFHLSYPLVMRDDSKWEHHLK